jgi:hypothetical protein
LRRYTTGSAATGSAKYRGVAVVGARLCLAPYNQDNVGVLDTETNGFSTIATTVGRCRLTVSKPELKAPTVTALEIVIPEIAFNVCFQFRLAPLHHGGRGFRRWQIFGCGGGGHLGRAVQVEPMKSMLKAPGTKRFKLQNEKLLSNFAFKSNVRRYSMVYFAPAVQNNVGVLDTGTNVFSTIGTTGDAGAAYTWGNIKYVGAAALGTKVGRCRLNR